MKSVLCVLLAFAGSQVRSRSALQLKGFALRH
jgi:hypothetical protein